MHIWQLLLHLGKPDAKSCQAIFSLVPTDPRMEIKQQATSYRDIQCFLGAGLYDVVFYIFSKNCFLHFEFEIKTPKPMGPRDPHRERQMEMGCFYDRWKSVWICSGFMYIELAVTSIQKRISRRFMLREKCNNNF